MRRRAGALLVSSQDVTLDFIFNERARELFAEEPRHWFFQINLTWGDQSLKIAPHNALWPIPETVISANTLGVINQNAGYSGAERNREPLNSVE